MRIVGKCFIFVLLSFLVLTNFEFTDPGTAIRVEMTRTRGTVVVNASGGGNFLKIQPAIDAANEGDTVYVEKGNYNENIEIDKSIDLVGEGSDNVTISYNTGWCVVYVTADYVNISGFSISGSIDWGDSGIRIYRASNCSVTNTNCTNNYFGILVSSHVDNPRNMIIANNTLFGNMYGVYIGQSQGNIISNNSLTNNRYGIYMESSNDAQTSRIISNSCLNNNINGIYLEESSNVEILSNTCLNNSDGIKLNNSFDNLIGDNKCNLNRRNGISISDSNNNNSSCESTNNVLRNNICNSNYENGINLEKSKRDILIDNNCSNNWNGIQIDHSWHITLERNALKSNGLYLRGGSLHNWNTHSIDTSNSVNGKPVQYWKNITGKTVPAGSGQIILVNCSNVIIENQELTDSTIGITLGFSSRNMISNNTCSSNGSGFENGGILLWYSHENIITKNRCNSNQGMDVGSGIQLLFSNRNNIFKNTCDSNPYYGISIHYSFNNSISNNTCSRNGEDGLYFYSSNGNIVDNNTYISNTGYGIATTSWSDKNAIYFNNFINNNAGGKQASDTGIRNRWNHSGKGNYWSDLTEPDSNLDGIVDLKYYLDGTASAKDHFPLTAPVQDIIPVANAGNNIEIDQHETAIFVDHVSLYCALIVNSTWNFTYDDEEVLLYGSPVDFTFHTAGKYLVELTVRNCVGDETNDTLLVTVNDITPPIANAGDDFSTNVGVAVLFNASNSSDNVAITVYRWRLYYIDEEISLYGRIAPFTFNKLGIYYITLDVLDAAGFSSSDTLNVTVVDATPPVADAGDNYTIQPGTTVYFDGSDSSDNIQIINYTWSFLYNRMNIKLYGEKTSFTFHIMGNYTVTLVVKDLFDLEGLDSIFVNVVPEEVDSDDEKPNADAGENLTVDKNSKVQLNSGGSWDNEGIVNYTWIIEYDGSNITLNRTNAIYRFEKIGVYNVTLRVEDAAGNVDEDRIMIIVTDHGNDEPDDDSDPDDTDPDDSEPSDGDGGREGASSIYLWVGIILLVFLGAAVGLAIVIIRKKTTDDVEKPQENEFGRTGNEE